MKILRENGNKISFDLVLTRFHKKEVHYKEDACEEGCEQEEECLMMRQSFSLVKIIADRLKKTGDPLLKHLDDPFVVGSIKELTKIFEMGKIVYL